MATLNESFKQLTEELKWISDKMRAEHLMHPMERRNTDVVYAEDAEKATDRTDQVWTVETQHYVFMIEKWYESCIEGFEAKYGEYNRDRFIKYMTPRMKALGKHVGLPYESMTFNMGYVNEEGDDYDLMIAKFRKKTVNEMWVDSAKRSETETYELFKNPTPRELQEIDGGSRGFINSNTGDLYVVNYSNIIHISIQVMFKEIFDKIGWGLFAVQRYGKTNNFYVGESIKLEDKNNQKRINMAKKNFPNKNPSLKFMPKNIYDAEGFYSMKHGDPNDLV